MNQHRVTPHRSYRYAAMLLATASLILPAAGYAYQPDAPFLDYQKRNAETWAQQDKAIDEKLAALEKKFGKKPNIIMVLSDDVGWGVLGSYGGGKVVGTPTPNLDTMARDGMKFLSAYSEPSCTPTRLALLTGRQPHRTGVNVVLWPGQKQGLAYSYSNVNAKRNSDGSVTINFGGGPNAIKNLPITPG